MRYRGVIEGFYGTPWSHADRLRVLDYLGTHDLNTYQYAPKDDPYHRERWREPYPIGKLFELEELVRRAIANDVDFTFALSPGLSIRYTNDADYDALIAKFEALYEIGVRTFTIPFDDIDYGTWHSAADAETYGDGPGASGRAQADFLNRVHRGWVASKGDVGPLQMVPTEYYDIDESEYKQALRERLDAAVVVHWTGVGVVPGTITTEQAATARAVFGHDIVLWDNFPVNDYIAGRIPLGPYCGREAGVADEIVGVLSNPMNQATVSRFALFSIAEYAADAEAYDPTGSWERALAELAGDDAELFEALRWFADLNTYDSTLHTEPAPRFVAALESFWESWNAGRKEAAIEDLRHVLDDVGHAPRLIRERVTEHDFVEEARPWLDATELWIGATRDALAVLLALDSDDGPVAWLNYQRAAELVQNAKAIRDSRLPHAETYPRVGDRVIDAFVSEAMGRFESYVGVGLDRPDVTASLRTYRDNELAHMVDGRLETCFRSADRPAAGDFVELDLKRVRPISGIAVLMASPERPEDYLKSGVLEYSADGTTWTELARGTTPELSASAPAGTETRFVRYRAAEHDPNRLLVREFAVEELDAVRTLVSGTPEPAEYSALAYAADDDLLSGCVAGRPPESDDALLVELSEPRPVDGARVLQGHDSAGTAEVEIRVDGEWRDIGALSGAYTALDFDVVTIDAIRLRWQAGDVVPKICEIVPSYVTTG